MLRVSKVPTHPAKDQLKLEAGVAHRRIFPASGDPLYAEKGHFDTFTFLTKDAAQMCKHITH